MAQIILCNDCLFIYDVSYIDLKTLICLRAPVFLILPNKLDL